METFTKTLECKTCSAEISIAAQGEPTGWTPTNYQDSLDFDDFVFEHEEHGITEIR